MTNQEIADLAETILLEEEDFLVAVKKLHELLGEEKSEFDLNSEDLIAVLEADERFRISKRPDDSEEEWPDEQDSAMRELGYYKGPRVMLVSRTPSRDELFSAMQAKMDRTLDSLKQAYRVQPEDSSGETDEQLIQIMKQTTEMQKKLEELKNKPNQDEEE
jgi:hypothetical protein